MSEEWNTFRDKISQTDPLIIALADEIQKLGIAHRSPSYIEYHDDADSIEDGGEIGSLEWFKHNFDENGDLIVRDKPKLDENGNVKPFPWHVAFNEALCIYAVCSCVRKTYLDDYTISNKILFCHDMDIIMKRLMQNHVSVIATRRGILYCNKFLVNIPKSLPLINDPNDSNRKFIGELLGYVVSYEAEDHPMGEDASDWYATLVINGIEVILCSEKIKKTDINEHTLALLNKKSKIFERLYGHLGEFSVTMPTR